MMLQCSEAIVQYVSKEDIVKIFLSMFVWEEVEDLEYSTMKSTNG